MKSQEESFVTTKYDSYSAERIKTCAQIGSPNIEKILWLENNNLGLSNKQDILELENLFQFNPQIIVGDNLINLLEQALPQIKTKEKIQHIINNSKKKILSDCLDIELKNQKTKNKTKI